MQIGNPEISKLQIIPNEERPLGNFNGKKVKKSCCDYCERLTVSVSAIFGATIASSLCYEMFLETTNSTPLSSVLFATCCLTTVTLGGILGGEVGALLFNPTHF